MKNPLRAIFGPKKEKSAAGYPLPISGGWIPKSWPINFWQTGKNPLGGGETSIVHACVDAYAQTIASMRGYHYKYSQDNTRKRLPNGTISRIMHVPNKYQTRSDLFLNMVKFLLLKGNAYAVGIRDNSNRFKELHLMDSNSTMPYIDEETKSIFYAVGGNPLLGDIDALIPARDVCHIRLYTPRNPLVGVSPLTYAAMSIAANQSITAHQAAFFENMSRPSGILSTDEKLTKEQMLQLRGAWNEQSQGLNAGGVPVLGNGMKWYPMSITSQDAQLVEAFNMTIEDIARAFRVPLPLVNDNRNSTYNNVEQLIGHWLAGGLGFMLDHVENSLDKFFGLPVNERIEFDTDTLMRTDFAGRVDGYTKSISGGLLAPNEARSKFGGLPPVEHGDKPIVQQQMVPLGWTEEQSKKPEPELTPEETAEAVKSNVTYLKMKMMSHG